MLFYLRCGIPEHLHFPSPMIPGETVHTLDLPALPGRKDLRFLGELGEHITIGETPSLDDIAARPDVSHQSAPVADPHPVSERVRIIVQGNDAALAAVATKLMRADALWVELAYIPCDVVLRDPAAADTPAAAASAAAGETVLSPKSVVASTWDLPELGDGPKSPASKAAFHFALTAPAVPTALIRDDQSVVTLGVAEIHGGDGNAMTGEVIVDSEQLYAHEEGKRGWFGSQRAGSSPFNNGVRLVPTLDAPGLAAVQRPPLPRTGLFGRPIAPSPDVRPTVRKGRALQAGGVDIHVIRDGLAHPRPVKAITFYRHLRDIQCVRR